MYEIHYIWYIYTVHLYLREKEGCVGVLHLYSFDTKCLQFLEQVHMYRSFSIYVLTFLVRQRYCVHF